MASLLDQLKAVTTVVADTGNIKEIARLRPTDGTTNPSLILAAASDKAFEPLVDGACAWGAALPQAQDASKADEVVALTMDKLAVVFGREILALIEGVVSTEVDARLSFDTDATVARARQLIKLYAEEGVAKERVLVKIAATWEGIRAAEILEKEGITCNLTLLFAFAQAVACAEAGVTLISPFVGRIMDWYVKNQRAGKGYENPAEDAGVQSVSRIYAYYKKHGYKTIVMGASFRNAQQITELAGCDKLTISPALLDALAAGTGELPTKLALPAAEDVVPAPAVKMSEAAFRWGLNEDTMATEKLAEGVRAFAKDCAKLEADIRARLAAKGAKLA